MNLHNFTLTDLKGFFIEQKGKLTETEYSELIDIFWSEFSLGQAIQAKSSWTDLINEEISSFFLKAGISAFDRKYLSGSLRVTGDNILVWSEEKKDCGYRRAEESLERRAHSLVENINRILEENFISGIEITTDVSDYLGNKIIISIL